MVKAHTAELPEAPLYLHRLREKTQLITSDKFYIFFVLSVEFVELKLQVNVFYFVLHKVV